MRRVRLSNVDLSCMPNHHLPKSSNDIFNPVKKWNGALYIHNDEYQFEIGPVLILTFPFQANFSKELQKNNPYTRYEDMKNFLVFYKFDNWWSTSLDMSSPNVIRTGSVLAELAGFTGFRVVLVWLKASNWQWLVSSGTGYKCKNQPVLHRTGH